MRKIASGLIFLALSLSALAEASVVVRPKNCSSREAWVEYFAGPSASDLIEYQALTRKGELITLAQGHRQLLDSHQAVEQKLSKLYMRFDGEIPEKKNEVSQAIAREIEHLQAGNLLLEKSSAEISRLVQEQKLELPTQDVKDLVQDLSKVEALLSEGIDYRRFEIQYSCNY